MENVHLTPINEIILKLRCPNMIKGWRRENGNANQSSLFDPRQLETRWNKPLLLQIRKKRKGRLISSFWEDMLKTWWIWKFCQQFLFLCSFFSFFNFCIVEILVFLISFNISKASTTVTQDEKEMHNYRAQPALDRLRIKASGVQVWKVKYRLPGMSWNSLAQPVHTWQSNGLGK